MPKPTPMQITLYDPETQEIKQTYSQLFVPWKLLKVAIELQNRLQKAADGSIQEEDADALAGLVCAVFGDRFSIEQLNNGADVSEMITVLNTIISKASGGMANPTPPGM